METSPFRPETGAPQPDRPGASAGREICALVLGRLPIVRAGISAMISDEFGAGARILRAGWADTLGALAAAGRNRLDLLVMQPERGGMLVDWPQIAAAARGAALVMAVPAADLGARQASAPAAVRFIALGAPLAAWRELLRAAVAEVRGEKAGGDKTGGAVAGARVRRAPHAAPAGLRAAGMSLTHRQRQVYNMLSLGYTNKNIAERLGLTVGTVKLHVGAVLQTLQAKNRVDILLRHTRPADGFPQHRLGVDAAVAAQPMPLASEEP